jgi:DnaJ-class molecular chaperone
MLVSLVDLTKIFLIKNLDIIAKDCISYSTMIPFEQFEKALKTLDITTKLTHQELKNRYKKLSKEFHPDKMGGDTAKFQEINEAYTLLEEYMKNFRFKLDEDEFYEQKPFMRVAKDWFYG